MPVRNDEVKAQSSALRHGGETSLLDAKLLIFDSSVEAGMPSVAAAPFGPATFPRLFTESRLKSFPFLILQSLV